MKARELFMIIYVVMSVFYGNAQTTETFTSPGTFNWVVPPCVTSITVQVWGGGGGGGSVWSRWDDTCGDPGCAGAETCQCAGGGGGGGFAQRTYTVTPGEVYTVVVGAGGAGGPINGGGDDRANDGIDGGVSTFSGPATVPFGTLTGFGGQGGGAANNMRDCFFDGCFGHQGVNGIGGSGGSGANGSIMYTGGDGANGAHSGSVTDKSGGGGGAAGTTSNGGDGAVIAGGTGGALGGGNGGAGIDQPYGSGYLGTNGNNGTVIGGGGGGAAQHNRIGFNRSSALNHVTQTGGNGRRGEVRIIYTAPVNTDPIFDPIGPICAGDPLSPLPTTSNNGVTGTWSPALDNNLTTTYTFTPTPGLCANPTDLQIIVNPNPVINNQPEDAAICANGSASLTVDATSGPYQWQYYDSGSMSWVNVTNGFPSGFSYSNVTSSTLDVSTSNALCSSPIEFRVIVGSSPCEVLSNTATITVVRASRIAPTGPQCSGTELNFEACPLGAVYAWEVFPPAGSSATPLTSSSETFSFIPTNNASVDQQFPITVSMTYLGVTCPQNFNPTVTYAPNAGASNTDLLCNSAGSMVDLNTLLEAGVTGGTWSETTGTPSGQFTPGTGILDGSGLTAGAYTFLYDIPATATCPGDQATFTVTVSNQETAGLDDLTLTLCNSGGSTIDLNSALNGNSVAGAWIETTASGQFTAGTGIFDAGGLTAGQYDFTYTVSSAAPCISDVANFEVTVTGVPNAGANNSDVLCNSAGSTIDLNTLLDVGVVGGTWTETTATPSGQFTPGTGIFDGSGLTAGAYTFLYDIPATATCPGDQATFTVTVSNQQTAGLDDLTLAICNIPGSTIDLNTALNGNSIAGTWAETSASGQFTAGTGVFDGTGLVIQTYTFEYTVSSTSPCISDVANFEVSVTGVPNAGADNSDILCNSAGSTIDLNTLLEVGVVGGTWSETTGTPSGQFTPGTGIFDGSGVTAGIYTFAYDIPATATCPGDQAIFTINVGNQETAGLDDLTLTLCNSAGSTIDLNTALSGNSIAGTWAETTSSGQFTAGTGIFDASGLAAGQYDFTYIVNSTAPCIVDVADFTVTISNQETAGLDDLTLTLCNSAGSAIDLNTALNGNSIAGTWAETSASGQFTAGTGILDGSSLAAGQYNFTYTVNSTSPCISDVADFTVTISNQETAGLDDLTIALCNSAGSTIDLNTALSGNSIAGTWAETTSSGQFTAGTGIFDASGLAAGQYDFTYTVNSTAPCISDVADFAVTVSATPTLTLQDTTDCLPFTVDLSDVNFWSADVGTLTWYSDAGLTTVLPTTSVGAGTYYVQADNAGCTTDGSVVVTEVTTPDVDPLGPISECDTYTLPVITGTALSGTEAYYTGMGGTGTAFNAGDAITTTGLTTLYIYDGASGCSDEEQLDITITVTPTITAADPAAVCEPNTVDITGSASADVGALTWYTDAALTTTVADPTQVTAGTYYVEAVNGICSSSDMVNVTVNPLPLAPTAGTDSTYCTSWVLEAMTATGGAGTMTWYDASNNVLGTGSSYTPDMTVGVTDYYVTETLAGCEGPASMVTITINNCDITIPTAITPNLDSNNDNWEIVDLDLVFPDNVVQVFNRWGNLIFEHVSSPSSPYDQNRWDGTYEGNTLPVGSYYYVIQANDADETVFTGAISIVLDK